MRMPRSGGTPPLWLYAVLLAGVIVAAYAPDTGRSFIKEDATWVNQSRIESVGDVPRLFRDTDGFFRPVVALSFGLNYLMFGSGSRGYGWTNLLLLLGVAAAIYRFGRLMGLPGGGALLAAGLWMLNFHGINMTLLWISGRTALLLTLFSLLAAASAARHHLAAASALALLAMLSKEEGILLPVVLLLIFRVRPGEAPPRRLLMAFAAALAAVCAAYVTLRMRSDAMTPGNANSFYRFMAPPWSFWKNAAEYADRSLSLTLAATALALVAGAQRPRLTPACTRLVLVGATWLVTGFALTMLLPNRSSLYAVYPSVGGALAAAAVLSAVWPRWSERQQHRLAAAALILPVVFLPIYWQRNERWTELADVSRATVAAFAGLAGSAPTPWHVVVIDDRSTRASIAAAIGWNLPDAVEIAVGKRPRVWLVPPHSDMQPHEWRMPPADVHAVIEFRDGTFERIPPADWTPAPAAEMP